MAEPMKTCANILAGTEPAVLSKSTDGYNSNMSHETMHEKAALKTAGLLSLILHPDLEGAFTPAALLASDNLAIFQLLPLIMAAIIKIGESASNRENYVKLISVFRNRIVACRGLKLRYLLLMQNDAFAAHCDVRMVHRRNCYTTARQYLEELSKDIDTQIQSSEAIKVASILASKDSSGDSATSNDLQKLGTGTIATNNLVTFVASSLLHPKVGIIRRTIVFRLRTVRNAFHGSDLVDGIMERSSFRNREDAVNIAQRILDIGLINKIASASKRFHDDKKSVFQCNFALQKDDDGQCKVITDDGYELTSWDAVAKSCNQKIKQITLQIPMDMVDLQSFEFWTKSVFVRGVDKGYKYGYRAITHPMFCEGMSTFKSLDFSHVQDLVKHEKNGLNNQDQDSLSNASSDSQLTSRSMISTEDINDLNQESAVIGSVIVRKVFSSIARPMIIQLRVPIENADLDEDDHHIVLHPGLLVKEGDNLMQDLGVEIMFTCFNHIWKNSSTLKKKYGFIPESITYEVFPTSATQGFMEAVTGLESLKDYNWLQWKEEFGNDENNVNEMLRTTVGSYVGTYIIGGRDRHFDNVLVKDDKHLLHIDFGFILGNNPPIDGPPIAIAPQMEVVFRQLGVWQKFIDIFIDAFMVLRENAPSIVRSSIILFNNAGFEDNHIRTFLQSKTSLNVHENDTKSRDFVKKQLVMSSSDIKTRFKQFSHEHIDPAWYGLLEKGFPPAVAIMKLVDAKDTRAAKKLAHARKLSTSATVPEDEKIVI